MSETCRAWWWQLRWRLLRCFNLSSSCINCASSASRASSACSRSELTPLPPLYTQHLSLHNSSHVTIIFPSRGNSGSTDVIHFFTFLVLPRFNIFFSTRQHIAYCKFINITTTNFQHYSLLLVTNAKSTVYLLQLPVVDQFSVNVLSVHVSPYVKKLTYGKCGWLPHVHDLAKVEQSPERQTITKHFSRCYCSKYIINYHVILCIIQCSICCHRVSVCLSWPSIVSKWLNLLSKFFQLLTAPTF